MIIQVFTPFISDIKNAVSAMNTFQTVSFSSLKEIQNIMGAGINGQNFVTVLQDLSKNNNITGIANSLKGLELEQAQLAMSTAGLNAETQTLALAQAGLLTTTEPLTLANIQEAMSVAGLEEAEITDELTKLELISVEGEDLILKNQLTTATVLQAVATSNLTNAQKNAIISNLAMNKSNISLGKSVANLGMDFNLLMKSMIGTIKNLWVFLTSNPIGWVIDAVVIIGALKLAFDKLNPSIEKQTEILKKSSEEYEKTKSNIESINSELTSQEKKIDELLSKDKLTYAEQGELERLQNITDELREQLRLEKAKAAAEGKQQADDAVTLFAKKMKGRNGKVPSLLNNEALDYQFDEQRLKESFSKYDNGLMAGIGTNNNYYIPDILASYKIAQEKLKEAYANSDQDAIDTAKHIIEEREKQLEEWLKFFVEIRKDLKDSYDSIKDIPEDQLSSDEKDIINTYKAAVKGSKFIYSNYKPEDWNKMQFESIFDTNGIEKTKEELIELAKSGKLDESVLNSYSNLNDAISNANFIIVEGSNNREAFINQIQGMAEVVDDVTEKIEQLSSADYKSALISDIVGLSEGFEELDKIYANISNPEAPFKYELLDDKKFKDTFKNYTKEYNEFIEVVSSSPDNIEACKSAFNNLISVWLDGKDALKNLNEENKQIAIDMLKNMGVTNAVEVVNSQLAKSIKKRTDALFEQKFATMDLNDIIENSKNPYEDLSKAIIFTEDEMKALIAVNPELKEQFKKTKEGIVLEEDAYKSLLEIILRLKTQHISAEIEKTQTVITQTGERLSAYKTELEAVKDLATAYGAIYDNPTNGAVFSSTDYQDYLKLREDNPSLPTLSQEDYNTLKQQAKQVQELGVAYEKIKNLKLNDSNSAIPEYDGGDETKKVLESLKDKMNDYKDKIEDTEQKIKDLNKQLKELDEKRDLEKLKKTMDDVAAIIDRMNSRIDILDMQLGFLDENDFANRADILSLKMQEVTNRSAALKAEFQRLANTTPKTADEANELASRISSISSELRSNLGEFVKIEKELQEVRIKELLEEMSTVDVGTIGTLSDRFENEIKAIESARKALKGETLFSPTSFFAALMPMPVTKKTELEKQKDLHQSQIDELQGYEDTVLSIKQKALEMQDAKNQEEYEYQKEKLQKELAQQERQLKEHQDKLAKLQSDFYAESNKKQAEYAATSQAAQKADDTVKEAETQDFSNQEKAIVTDLNNWMSYNPVTAPMLDVTSWDNMVATAGKYADTLKGIFADVQTSISDVNQSVGEWGSNNSGMSSNGGSLVSPTNGNAAVNEAMSYLGVPYVYGGSSKEGIDCSGLTQAIAKKMGVNIDHNAAAQFADPKGKNISKADLQVGDFVYFRNSEGKIHHTGMYIGNGQMIHAPQTGKTVEITSLDTDRRNKEFAGGKRFFYDGTPKGHKIAKDTMVIGETYEDEIIGYKDGSREVVNVPTIRNKKDVDYVIGVEDTKKISYAGGYRNADIVNGLPKLSQSEIETALKIKFKSSSVVKPERDAVLLYEAQQRTGVSALLPLAISGEESGWGTSSLAKDYNNIWGWGATNKNTRENAKKFSSMSDAVPAYFDFIKNTYYNKRGATSLHAIGTGENPSGLGYAYHNDGSIDKSWVNRIESCMNDIVSAIGGISGNVSTISDNTVSNSQITQTQQPEQPTVKTVIIEDLSKTEQRQKRKALYETPKAKVSDKEYQVFMSLDSYKSLINTKINTAEAFFAEGHIGEYDVGEIAQEVLNQVLSAHAHDSFYKNYNVSAWADNLGNITDVFYSDLETMTGLSEGALEYVKQTAEKIGYLKKIIATKDADISPDEVLQLGSDGQISGSSGKVYGSSSSSSSVISGNSSKPKEITQADLENLYEQTKFAGAFYLDFSEDMAEYYRLQNEFLNNLKEQGGLNHNDIYKALLDYTEGYTTKRGLGLIELQTIQYRQQMSEVVAVTDNLINDYRNFSAEYNKYMAEGNTTAAKAVYEQLEKVYSDLQSAQSKAEDINSQWNSLIKETVDFNSDVLNSRIGKNASPLYWADRELNERQLKYDRQDRFRTQIIALNEVNKVLIRQSEIYQKNMDLAHEWADELRKTYSDVYEVFTWQDVDSWFNPDGSLSTTYYDTIKSLQNSPILDHVRKLAESLVPIKQAYYENSEKLLDNEKTLWENERSLWKHNLDLMTQIADNIMSVHDTMLSRLDRELNLLQRKLDNFSKYSDKLSTYDDIVDNYRDSITVNANKKAEADRNVQNLLSNSKYSQLIKMFDVSKWIDVSGELTGYYTNDLNNIDKINSKELYELAEEFSQLFSTWSKMSYDGQTAIEDLSDSLRDAVDNQKQMQIDAINTATDKVVEMLEYRKEKELKLLDKTHEKRIKQLEEESEFTQKAYEKATNMLDDVKSEEDYEKSLSKEQKKADQLQQRINNLSMSDNDADRQLVLELQKELNEQLDHINDMQRDHEHEQKKKALADDLKEYTEFFSDLTEAENDHYTFQQELINGRYTQEAMYNEALKILNSGTFTDIEDMGVYTYEQIFSKGNEVSLKLGTAYTNMATVTGEAFRNLGIDFENNLDLLKDTKRVLDAIGSDVKDWGLSKNLYGDEDDYDYKINEKSTSNKYAEKELGVNTHTDLTSKYVENVDSYGGVSSVSSDASSSSKSGLYMPDNQSEQSIIDKMKANSKAWRDSDDDKRYELHKENIDLAGKLGLSGDDYDSASGKWIKDGLPIYHKGKFTKLSKQLVSVKRNEIPCIIRNDESVIPDNILSNMMPVFNPAKASDMIKNINNLGKSFSMGDINVSVQGNADRNVAKNIADEVAKVIRSNRIR